MSAEVVKKRGRPKKVVSESIAVESMEPVKKGTRRKSTKASAPRSAATSNKAAKLPMAATEDTPSPSPPSAPPETNSETIPIPIKSSTKSSPSKVTPANSKILDQVRALSSKTPSAAKSSSATLKTTNPTSPASSTTSRNTKPLSQTNTAKPLAPATPSKLSFQKAEQEPPVFSQSGVLNISSSQPSPITSNSQPQTQTPQKPIPIAALNSTIVSQISSKAGARPSRPSTDLPANYKPVARRVTLAIVALPIAIVTSWVLYQRLILGEERKHLVRPGMVLVEESPSMTEIGGNISERDT